jgi:hypothetical protein
VAPLLFHHARTLAHVRHGVVRGAPPAGLLPEPDCAGGCPAELDDYHAAVLYDAAYAWLRERLGFWPLFLAVGEEDEDLRMTG